MDKLHICVMGIANTSTPCFKNISDTSFIPAALLMMHAFRRREIVFERTIWKFSVSF